MPSPSWIEEAREAPRESFGNNATNGPHSGCVRIGNLPQLFLSAWVCRRAGVSSFSCP